MRSGLRSSARITGILGIAVYRPSRPEMARRFIDRSLRWVALFVVAAIRSRGAAARGMGLPGADSCDPRQFVRMALRPPRWYRVRQTVRQLGVKAKRPS